MIGVWKSKRQLTYDMLVTRGGPVVAFINATVGPGYIPYILGYKKIIIIVTCTQNNLIKTKIKKII